MSARPHRCDERCACPVHGTPLIYWPAGDDHACQDPGCEFAHGLVADAVMTAPVPLRPPPPPAMTCAQCGEVYDDWEWDELDQEWEADFEWWRHPVSGHGFLCSRGCWLKAHRAHCGSSVPCREPS